MDIQAIITALHAAALLGAEEMSYTASAIAIGGSMILVGLLTGSLYSPMVGVGVFAMVFALGKGMDWLQARKEAKGEEGFLNPDPLVYTIAAGSFIIGVDSAFTEGLTLFTAFWFLACIGILCFMRFIGFHD